MRQYSSLPGIRVEYPAPCNAPKWTKGKGLAGGSLSAVVPGLCGTVTRSTWLLMKRLDTPPIIEFEIFGAWSLVEDLPPSSQGLDSFLREMAIENKPQRGAAIAETKHRLFRVQIALSN